MLLPNAQNVSIQVQSSRSSPLLQNKTVIPTTNTQYITASSGYDGLNQVTLNGDSNFKANNIVKGITIWGLTGSYAGFSHIKSRYLTQNYSNNYKTLTLTLPNGVLPNQIAGVVSQGSGNTRITGIYETYGGNSFFTWLFGYYFLQNYFGEISDGRVYRYESFLSVRFAQSSNSPIYVIDTTYGFQSYSAGAGIYVSFPTINSVELTINSNYSSILKGVGNSTNTTFSFSSLYWHPYMSVSLLYYN